MRGRLAAINYNNGENINNCVVQINWKCVSHFGSTINIFANLFAFPLRALRDNKIVYGEVYDPLNWLITYLF